MKEFSELQKMTVPTVVALGCFDGLHKGHRKVLAAALKRQGELLAAVVTFRREDLNCMKQASLLMTAEQERAALEKLGFDLLFSLSFAQYRNTSPEDFVVKYLIGQLNAKRICCGFNYHFGKDGKGDAPLLQSICEKYGVICDVLPPEEVCGVAVSSHRIRRAVEEGDMTLVTALQGFPFSLEMPVIHGNHIGRTLGTPTVNQRFPEGFTLPRFGVYAAAVEINGEWHYAVANVGVKPTVGSDYPLMESWIGNYSGDLYGKVLRIYLLIFLRPEQKFASLEQLQRQILRDGNKAAEIWQEYDKTVLQKVL